MDTKDLNDVDCKLFGNFDEVCDVAWGSISVHGVRSPVEGLEVPAP